MAQLNDTMVQGDLRVTGKIYGTGNAIRVEDANLAIPPLGVGDSVGSTGDFFISSGSGKNLPNTVDNFDIHTTVTHYASTTYRLSQIATPTSSSNPAGIYERGASSSDGVTWTFGDWAGATNGTYSSVKIPANANLNNYNTDNRIYQCNATNAPSVSNRPSGASGAFELEVILGTGNTCVQIYYSRDDVSFNYIRKYTGDNKWTAWNRISLASDANGAYFATYGSTSHADVLAANQAGKAVFCISGTDYAPLTGISSTSGVITFAKSTTGGVTMYYQLSTDDKWSSGTSADCRVAFSAISKSENTSDGCTLTFTAINGSKKTVTVRNVVNAGNANTVDGYHIVVGSTGTDSKTIYFT